jgi:NTP pyrophosphatase (non-canonical NTP hydrolase)
MALSVEVGELIEIFQWLTPADSQAVMDEDERATRVKEEIADVFGYVLRLADVLSVDLVSALTAKIGVNESKYPIAKSRGTAKKYTEFTDDSQ